MGDFIEKLDKLQTVSTIAGLPPGGIEILAQLAPPPRDCDGRAR